MMNNDIFTATYSPGSGPLKSKPINTSYYDFATLMAGGFVYVADGRRNYDPAVRTFTEVRAEQT